MYVVLTRFADLTDGKRIYEAGDVFPRPGLNVTPERLCELAGSDNRMGKPLIVDVDAPCDACRVDTGAAPAEADPPTRKPRAARKRAPKGADGQ